MVYEALCAEAGDWRILQPADPEHLARQVATALPAPGVVLWLDGLRDYLVGSHALPIGEMRRLLDPQVPMIIVGTLWSSVYDQLTMSEEQVWQELDAAMPAMPSGVLEEGRHLSGGMERPGRRWDFRKAIHDPFHDARLILETLARCIGVADFDEVERVRMEALIRRDPRLRLALEDEEHGVAQFLAGAPELIKQWLHRGDVYGRAVITASVDLRRAGVNGPLSRDLLKAATWSMLDARSKASADEDWFEPALGYASRLLRGATSALSPVAGEAPGTVEGYNLADYLMQYGSALRDALPVSAGIWSAVEANLSSADEMFSAASAAHHRFHIRLAEKLFLCAASLGSVQARTSLARLYLEQGRHDEARAQLREALAGGDRNAAQYLGMQRDGTREIAEAIEAIGRQPQSSHRDRQMAALLATSGRFAEAARILGPLADAGDRHAVRDLVKVLVRSDRHQEAVETCRRAVADGDVDMRRHLFQLLQSMGRWAVARSELEAGVTAGDTFACQELVKLYMRDGHLDSAAELCRNWAALGDHRALLMLLRIFVRNGDTEQARHVIRMGLADGRLSHEHLLLFLTWFSTADQAIAEWEAAVKAGVPGARQRLAQLLERTGKIPEAIEVRRAAAVAREPGALRELADTLAKWHFDQEAVAKYREAIEAGDTKAYQRLALALESAGRRGEAVEALKLAVGAGSRPARRRLAELLARMQERQQALEHYELAVCAGDRMARAPYLSLLTRQRGRAEAQRVLRGGIDPPAADVTSHRRS